MEFNGITVGNDGYVNSRVIEAAKSAVAITREDGCEGRMFLDDKQRMLRVFKDGTAEVLFKGKQWKAFTGIDANGYRTANFNCFWFEEGLDGIGVKERQVKVHRLVKLMFDYAEYEQRVKEDGPLVVCHIDGKKDRCCLGNLEYGTQAENLIQAQLVKLLHYYFKGEYTYVVGVSGKKVGLLGYEPAEKSYYLALKQGIRNRHIREYLGESDAAYGGGRFVLEFPEWMFKKGYWVRA